MPRIQGCFFFFCFYLLWRRICSINTTSPTSLRREDISVWGQVTHKLDNSQEHLCIVSLVRHRLDIHQHDSLWFPLFKIFPNSWEPCPFKINFIWISPEISGCVISFDSIPSSWRSHLGTKSKQFFLNLSDSCLCQCYVCSAHKREVSVHSASFGNLRCNLNFSLHILSLLRAYFIPFP